MPVNTDVYRHIPGISGGEFTYNSGGAAWTFDVDCGQGPRDVFFCGASFAGATSPPDNCKLSTVILSGTNRGKFRIHAWDANAGVAYTGSLTVRWLAILE